MKKKLVDPRREHVWVGKWGSSFRKYDNYIQHTRYKEQKDLRRTLDWELKNG